MRPLRCILGHAWQGRCNCSRCGARNWAVEHVLDESCRCTVCGGAFHDFVARNGTHRCDRCGLEEDHVPQLTNFRLVDVGAWDSTFGAYDVQYADEVCARCEKVLRTEVDTGYRSGGPYL